MKVLTGPPPPMLRGTIRIAGESGYARYLAKSSGAEIRRLEPSPVAQIAALGTQFTGDEVMLFFVLREAVRLRARDGLSGASLDAAIIRLLAKAAPLVAASKLRTSISDLATLAAAAGRVWPGRDWRDVPAEWFTPWIGPQAQFTNRINAMDSHYRNRHVIGAVDAALNEGRNVFVLIGRDHVPALAPALRCVVGRQ